MNGREKDDPGLAPDRPVAGGLALDPVLPAPPERPPALQPIHGLLAFGLAVFLMIGLSLVSVVVPESARALATFGSSGLAMGLAVWAVLRLAGAGRRALALAPPISVRQAAGGLLLGIGLVALAASLTARLYAVFGADAYLEALEKSFRALEESVGWLGLLALGGLILPAVEELLFRGLILRSFLARWPPLRAVTVSALLFGLLHLHPAHVLIAFFLGVAAGWAAVATGSLRAAVIVHATNNTLALAVSFFVAPEADYLAMAWALPAAATLAAGWMLIGRRGSA